MSTTTSRPRVTRGLSAKTAIATDTSTRAMVTGRGRDRGAERFASSAAAATMRANMPSPRY
jgi:hypothetical protein